MLEREVLKISNEDVVLDPDLLKFNETTLNEYIQKEGALYDNFGGYLARAERLLQICESVYDDRYNTMFHQFKADGGSDKLAEARAKTDDGVQDARASVIEAKYIVSRLKNHLRAWDRNHENAQSMGHNLRKEMERINFDIKSLEAVNARHDAASGNLYSRFSEVDSVVGHFDTD